MGKFKDLEIPENESDINSTLPENLTLFTEDMMMPLAGRSRTPRYLADIKSMLKLLDLKIKVQRIKTSTQTQKRAA